jgi:glycosyltransferase involved in cell wall biosynthesis
MNAFISIIIPIKNESGNIRQLVTRINDAMQAAQIAYRMVFVDGHSTDDGLTILRSLEAQYPITIIEQRSTGKALGVIEGVLACNTEFVVMIDADLQYPPETIPEMWSMHTKFPIVVARRTVHNESLLRKLPSLIHSFLYGRLLFGLRCDVQSGLKLFPKKLIEYIDTEDISPWTLDLALILAGQSQKLAIGEVPIEFV